MYKSENDVEHVVRGIFTVYEYSQKPTVGGSNKILASSAHRPRLLYGTSGYSNLYEILLTAFISARNGLAMSFFNYANTGKQFDLITRPSLGLLNQGEIGYKINNWIKLLNNGVLKIQVEIAKWFVHACGYKLDIKANTLVSLIKTSGVWQMSIEEYFEQLRQVSPTGYAAFTAPNGEKIYRSSKTNLKPYAGWTIGTLHTKGGILSGRGIHFTMARLYQNTGPFVSMVIRGNAGEVYNMYSKLQNPPCVICSPVKIRAEGQSERYAPIDPIVFMTLLNKWGTKKATDTAKYLWDTFEEANQKRQHIYLLVTKNGLVRE